MAAHYLGHLHKALNRVLRRVRISDLHLDSSLTLDFKFGEYDGSRKWVPVGGPAQISNAGSLRWGLVGPSEYIYEEDHEKIKKYRISRRFE